MFTFSQHFQPFDLVVNIELALIQLYFMKQPYFCLGKQLLTISSYRKIHSICNLSRIDYHFVYN